MKITAVILSLFVILTGCTNTSKVDTKSLLIGQWEFENGTINGDSIAAVELLKKTQFEFSTDSISCNLFEDMGLAPTMSYNLNDQLIETSSNTHFKIETITEQQLNLSFTFTFNQKTFNYTLQLKN